VRRYAAAGSEYDLEACAELLRAAPSPGEVVRLAAALDAGLAAPPPTPASGALRGLLDRLAASQPLSPVLVRLRVRLGCPGAVEDARRVALDAAAGEDSRLAAIGAIGEGAGADGIATLLLAAAVGQPDAVRRAAVAALSRHGDERVPAALLPLCSEGSPPLRAAARSTLLGRREWASQLLSAFEGGDIATADVPADEQRRLAALGDAALDARARKLWGAVHPATPEEKLAEVRRLQNDLRAGPGDAGRGRELFSKHCGTCHKLFGEGGSVGPDLTAANRADRESLLISLVDPGAQVRREYLSYTVATRDGRLLSGLMEQMQTGALAVIAATGERTELERSAVARLEESETSLMPEGLLQKLTPAELRDLFAYLQRH
jgi:putative heme-binding domain-containing protein